MVPELRPDPVDADVSGVIYNTDSYHLYLSYFVAIVIKIENGDDDSEMCNLIGCHAT